MLGDKGNFLGSAGASNYSGDGRGGQVNMDRVGGSTGNVLRNINGKWTVVSKATGQPAGGQHEGVTITPAFAPPPTIAAPVTVPASVPTLAPDIYMDPQIAGMLQAAIAPKVAAPATPRYTEVPQNVSTIKSASVPAGQKVTDVFGPKVDLDPQVKGMLEKALTPTSQYTGDVKYSKGIFNDNVKQMSFGGFPTSFDALGKMGANLVAKPAVASQVPAGQKVTDVFGPDYAQDPSIAGLNQTALSDRSYGMADIKINEDGSLSVNKDQARLDQPSFDNRTNTDMTNAVTGESAPKAYDNDPYSVKNMAQNLPTPPSNGLPNIAASIKKLKQITDRVPQERTADDLASIIDQWSQAQAANNAAHQRAPAAPSQSSVLDHIFGGKPSVPASITPTADTPEQQGMLHDLGDLLKSKVNAGMNAFGQASDQIDKYGGPKMAVALAKLFGGGMSPGKFGTGGQDKRGDGVVGKKIRQAMKDKLGIDVGEMDQEQLLKLSELLLNPQQPVAA